MSNKDFLYDEMGDDHFLSSGDTPLRNDAFNLSDEEKIKLIEKNFGEIMQTLGLDLTDDSLKGTRSEERRVGKECRWRWGAYDEKKKERDEEIEIKVRREESEKRS